MECNILAVFISTDHLCQLVAILKVLRLVLELWNYFLNVLLYRWVVYTLGRSSVGVKPRREN